MTVHVPISVEEAGEIADQLDRLAHLERDHLTAAAVTLVADRDAGLDTRTRAGHLVVALASTAHLEDLAARVRLAEAADAGDPAASAPTTTPAREDATTR
jgi:hypothetical protein